MTLLEVDGLTKWYRGATRAAVDDISLRVDSGRTLGIVGESGSGKTTLTRCVLLLLTADSGSVRFEGQDFFALRGPALRRARARIQLVPQHPDTSLSPRMTIADAIAFNLSVHRWGRSQRAQRIAEVLDLVGLAAATAERYPGELSGGQLQRVAIARALSTNPALIVCDEAVSALDKSVQAQILNLLQDVQRERGIAYLFISHDLSVVEHVSHDVIVMKSSRVVEAGPMADVWSAPADPYTRLLLASLPGPDRHTRPYASAEGG